MDRVLAEHVGPAGFAREADVFLAFGALELDRLDAVAGLLLAWVLQENQAALLRQQLKQLGQAEVRIPSSWSLTVLSVDVLRQQVRGNWGQARLQSCLGQLERFLTGRVRQQRQHQETSMRAWLERLPRPNLVLEMAA